MLGLPQLTETSKQLPKKAIFTKLLFSEVAYLFPLIEVIPAYHSPLFNN